ncbi:Uncharacterised protein [Vibrio cholerae]|nr:Uncharacterised protein [Vibrio cholerae]
MSLCREIFNVWITDSMGIAKDCCSSSNIMTREMVIESGRIMVISLPFPGSEESVRVPPLRSIAVRTASIPTPRPERSLTCSTVEKPGSKIK